MTEDDACSICFALARNIPQDVLLEQLGAVRLWQDQQRHDKEQHDEHDQEARQI